MEDKQFWSQFMMVISALVVIAIVAIVISRIITGGDTPETTDPIVQKVIEERIKPVGGVHVGEVPAQMVAKSDAGTSQSASQGSAKKYASGKEVYEAVCLACHSTGAAGAPKYGDKGGWAKYLDKGLEGNYAAAINGAGAMPAKGGRSDLSDEDVKAAVDYLFDSLN